MRKFIFTLSVFSFAFSSFAQEGASNKKNDRWKLGALFTVTAGQGGSRNWTPGAERFSFLGSARMNLYAKFKDGKHSWESLADLAYGMVNTTSLGIRKSQDKIDVVSKYGYSVHSKVDIGAWFNVRTQFSDGFDYSESPKRRISGVMAPGYITLAAGFDCKPFTDNFSIFVSPVMARLVVVTNRPYSFSYQGGVKPDGTPETTLASRYGVDPVRKVDGQVGAMVSVGYHKKDLVKNVDIRSRADVFSNYLNNAQNFDVFLNNLVIMRVNNWLQVNYGFDVIYDDDQRQFGPLKNKPATQLHTMLGVGVAAKL